MVETGDLIEADKVFQEATGINPEKAMHIGRELKFGNPGSNPGGVG